MSNTPEETKHTKGCGKPTHVAGTNGGTMPCGALLSMPGETAKPYYCGECEKETKHTPGPVHISDDIFLVGADHELILKLIENRAIDRANLRRIVACWNACKDMETAELESVNVLTEINKYATQRNKFEVQRDELLAALIRLRDCPDVQMDCTDPETDAARLQANAAIAKVEGR